MKRGQVAIEYLILVAFSVLFFLVLTTGIVIITGSKNDEKAYVEMIDYGSSLQQEFILAAQVQDGYRRTLVLPPTFNGQNYDVNIINGTATANLLEFQVGGKSVYYRIPAVTGSIAPGTQTLAKVNGSLVIQ